jgi:hypothetical protein
MDMAAPCSGVGQNKEVEMAGWGALERVRVARIGAIVAIAIMFSMTLLGGSTASAGEPCTKLTGEGIEGEKSEKLKLNAGLTTDLNEKQKLAFSWEGGKERFKLQALTKATCNRGRRGATFSGAALGTLNSEGGYTMSFSLKISVEEEVTLKAKVKLKTELIEEFEVELEEGEKNPFLEII